MSKHTQTVVASLSIDAEMEIGYNVNRAESIELCEKAVSVIDSLFDRYNHSISSIYDDHKTLKAAKEKEDESKAQVRREEIRDLRKKIDLLKSEGTEFFSDRYRRQREIEEVESEIDSIRWVDHPRNYRREFQEQFDFDTILSSMWFLRSESSIGHSNANRIKKIMLVVSDYSLSVKESDAIFLGSIKTGEFEKEYTEMFESNVKSSIAKIESIKSQSQPNKELP